MPKKAKEKVVSPEGTEQAPEAQEKADQVEFVNPDPCKHLFTSEGWKDPVKAPEGGVNCTYVCANGCGKEMPGKVGGEPPEAEGGCDKCGKLDVPTAALKENRYCRACYPEPEGAKKSAGKSDPKELVTEMFVFFKEIVVAMSMGRVNSNWRENMMDRMKKAADRHGIDFKV